jgi:hypothetical protein
MRIGRKFVWLRTLLIVTMHRKEILCQGKNQRVPHNCAVFDVSGREGQSNHSHVAVRCSSSTVLYRFP